ncbi:hypothetical protein PHSC3_001494 [Chlamydiales bacterium STE3]|nr:hypothetical protein PHSC3_001494 [Chlamydiales bacterium STE3]
MASQVVVSRSLVEQFTLWGDKQREAILVPYASVDVEMPTRMGQEVGQGVIFRNDFKRHIHTLSTQTKYELASLAQSIATLIASPFFIFGEIYKLCNGAINASTCLKNICVVPKHIIFSIFKTAFYIARAVNGIASAASIGVGFLTWHTGEKLVRLITGSPHTVLSNNPQIRNIVYHSLGLTLLAAGSLFIPITHIQMIALPIILGSLYGTLNNQFTVRECPEYYTMGHHYDGTDLKGHAIKSNNLLIKPIVTGCYATTMVTKLAGIILSAVGTIPYTAAILPVPLAGALIAGTCAVALVTAHIFSTVKKNSIQKNLNEYAALIGIEWHEANRNKSWADLAELRTERIKQKRHELASNAQELEAFNRRLDKLTEAIESNILNDNMPVKYIVGWQANNTRNSVGYLFAGGGALAIAVTAIFLRIFVL